MPKHRTLRCTIIASFLCAAAGALHAQSFPSKPITLIVPFPPGGVSDPVARLMGAKIAESTGQQFLVDNKPSAASIIGAEIVKRAPPEGYTLFVGHFASNAVNPHVYKKLSYDPVKDFEPITPIISTRSLLVVPLESPARTVADLVALSKARPNGLSYASQGVAADTVKYGRVVRDANNKRGLKLDAA